MAAGDQRKARLRMRKRRGPTFETARRMRIENMRLRDCKYARKAFIKELEEQGLQEQALYVGLLCCMYGFGKAVTEYAIERYILTGKEFPDRFLLDGELDSIARWIDKRTKVHVLSNKRPKRRKSEESKRAKAKGEAFRREMAEIRERGETKGALIVQAMEALKDIKL